MKNKKHPFSLLIILLAFLSSCKVQEEIYFNKDMSGKMYYKVDMSAMRAFSTQMQGMQGFGENDKDNDNDSLQTLPPKNPFAVLDTLNYEQLTSQFGYLKGISNAVVKRGTEGIIEISFDFKDLNALNSAYGKINMSSDLINGSQNGFKLGEAPDKEPDPTFTPYHAYFSQKGKTITFTPAKKEKGEDKANTELMNSMKQMGEAAFEYKTKISFERNVKSIKSKDIQADQQENDILIKGNPKNLPANAELKIKLK